MAPKNYLSTMGSRYIVGIGTYLIILPILFWVGLKCVLLMRKPDAAAKERLWRTVAGAVAGAFLVGAVLTAQAESHTECDEAGAEPELDQCLEGEIRMPGPDEATSLMLFLLGVGAFLLSVDKWGSTSED